MYVYWGCPCATCLVRARSGRIDDVSEPSTQLYSARQQQTLRSAYAEPASAPLFVRYFGRPAGPAPPLTVLSGSGARAAIYIASLGHWPAGGPWLIAPGPARQNVLASLGFTWWHYMKSGAAAVRRNNRHSLRRQRWQAERNPLRRTAMSAWIRLGPSRPPSWRTKCVSFELLQPSSG